MSVRKLPGGIEEAEHSGPTPREGSGFGSGPDELTFPACQLWPPRENDALEVVFGRPPIEQGKR